MARVDPIDPPRVDTPPPVRIERLILNGEPLTVAPDRPGSGPEPLVLPPGYNRFEVHYAGLTFLAPESVRFRHRLRGLSDEWEEADRSRVAQFRALPPGHYEFEVAAAHDAGRWSQPPVGLGSRVLAPWWQTAWLKAFAAAAILASLGAGYVLQRSAKQ